MSLLSPLGKGRELNSLPSGMLWFRLSLEWLVFTSTTTSTAWWVKFLLSSFHYWRRAAKFGPLLNTYILWVPCDTEPRFVQSHLNDCHIQSQSMASQGYWGPVLTPQEPSKRGTTECNQNHCTIRGFLNEHAAYSVTCLPINWWHTSALYIQDELC